MRKIYKSLVRLSIALGIYGAFWFVWLLPVCTYGPLSLILGTTGYYTMRLSRRRILANLSLAFGNSRSESWRQRTCRRLLQEIVRNAIEIIAWSKSRGQAVEKCVSVTGAERLSQALQEERGVVAVCAHLGNFPALQIKLLRMGFPMKVIIRNATNVYLNRLWARMMTCVGMRYIYKADLRRAIEASRQSLRQGDCLCIYLDQHAGNGVRAPFFGHQVMVPVGAAVLSRKYQSPVVGIFTFRGANGRHQVVIEGPYRLQRTTDAEADIRANTALFISRVEAYVRQHPEQWFSWVHRRFR